MTLRIRHWKQRYDPSAKMILAKSMLFNGKQLTEGQELPDWVKQMLGPHKLRRWWEGNLIQILFDEVDEDAQGELEENPEDLDSEGDSEGDEDPEGDSEGDEDPEGDSEGDEDPEGDSEGDEDPEGDSEGDEDPEGDSEGDEDESEVDEEESEVDEDESEVDEEGETEQN